MLVTCWVKLNCCFLKLNQGPFVIAFDGVSDAAIEVELALFDLRQLGNMVCSLDVQSGLTDRDQRIMTYLEESLLGGKAWQGLECRWEAIV